jgi:hypothetical protein
MLLLARSSFTMGSFSCVSGAFPSTSNPYLGVRVFLAGDTLYGWLKLSASVFSVTLEEYACNKGVTAAGELPSISYMLFPNPASGYLQLQAKSIFKNKRYKIVDASGKLAAEGVLNADCRIAIHALAPGIYLLGLEGLPAKKIVVIP